jgi:hypothetical protein
MLPYLVNHASVWTTSSFLYAGVDEDDAVVLAGVYHLVVLGRTARTRDILDAVLLP